MGDGDISQLQKHEVEIALLKQAQENLEKNVLQPMKDDINVIKGLLLQRIGEQGKNGNGYNGNGSNGNGVGYKDDIAFLHSVKQVYDFTKKYWFHMFMAFMAIYMANHGTDKFVDWIKGLMGIFSK